MNFNICGNCDERLTETAVRKHFLLYRYVQQSTHRLIRHQSTNSSSFIVHHTNKKLDPIELSNHPFAIEVKDHILYILSFCFS